MGQRQVISVQLLRLHLMLQLSVGNGLNAFDDLLLLFCILIKEMPHRNVNGHRDKHQHQYPKRCSCTKRPHHHQQIKQQEQAIRYTRSQHDIAVVVHLQRALFQQAEYSA